MAFDIYGEHLRPGYCEVHPDVNESYPCSACAEETRIYSQPEPQQPEPTLEDDVNYQISEAIAALIKQIEQRFGDGHDRPLIQAGTGDWYQFKQEIENGK